MRNCWSRCVVYPCSHKQCAVVSAVVRKQVLVLYIADTVLLPCAVSCAVLPYACSNVHCCVLSAVAEGVSAAVTQDVQAVPQPQVQGPSRLGLQVGIYMVCIMNLACSGAFRRRGFRPWSGVAILAGGLCFLGFCVCMSAGLSAERY